MERSVHFLHIAFRLEMRNSLLLFPQKENWSRSLFIVSDEIRLHVGRLFDAHLWNPKLGDIFQNEGSSRNILELHSFNNIQEMIPTESTTLYKMARKFYPYFCPCAQKGHTLREKTVYFKPDDTLLCGG